MDLLQYNHLHIHPVAELKGSLTPPSAKSYSARAVLAAALAEGTSRIDNVAWSNNVRAMMECCTALGADLVPTASGDLDVTGVARFKDGVTLSPGNSGIVLRLLMGAVATNRGVTFLTPYVDSLGRRGNSEMVDALRQLGVAVTARGGNGCLPITIDGTSVHGGDVSISGRRSSQFLSGLLFLGGLLDEPLSIVVTDELMSKPMVETTLRVLATAGVQVSAEADLMRYYVEPGTRFRPAHYACGSDPASTAGLLAVAASVNSTVDLNHNGLDELGGVLDYLRAMGVSLSVSESAVRVTGGGELRPQDFDGSTAPDAVLPLAALAANADGTSRFYNIEHIRYKECDRISDFRRELTRAGVSSDEKRDELIIHGSSRGVAGNVVVESHYDHAVVLAMSVIALRSQRGLIIKDPQYVAQTYPKFFTDLQRIGGTVTV
jgi:3-phosphoshikimate 1-carboxyvinyltransferase